LGWNLHGLTAGIGDLVEMVGLRHKHFIITLKEGGEFQSHRGVVKHDDIIGRPWGSQVFSHNGSPFFMLQPSLSDLLRSLPRSTQILYSKDIGFILIYMGIGPGQHVLEAGTGSGALTSAMAFAVGPQGKVTTYEAREEFQTLAHKNLDRLGLVDRVDFKLRRVEDGFDETGVDALFLDLPNPYDYMSQVRAALKPGGFFGSILPTTNQVTKLVQAMNQTDFAFIDVMEILLRFYKSEPDRFRPADRMVAHTGYLVFGRPILVDHAQQDGTELLAEINAHSGFDGEE
jgi:tRNA (adenine57-N1/adenine58-N1)-methyltransferase catalytic subunit